MTTAARGRTVAHLVLATCVLLTLGQIAIQVATGSFGFSADWGTERVALAAAAPALAFPAVGWLVATRRPADTIGWLCLAIGLGFGVTVAAGVYANVAAGTDVPAADVVRWLADWSYTPSVVALAIFVPLLFPDGRLLSRRWRPVAWAGAVLLVLGSLSEALRPGPLANTPDAVNPVGIESARGLLEALDYLFVLLPLGIVAAAASVVVRFRRAGAHERLQLKWFVSAGVVLAAVFVGQFVLVQEGSWGQDLLMVVFAALPLAIGVAMLRHQLYGIDVVIRRTIVYTALTALLAAAYLSTVLVLQFLLPARSDLAVAVSTLAVAALFRPARARVQAAVDRRFFRRRVDAVRTLDAFAARVRDEVALDALSTDLRDVVADALQPAHISLWLRP